MSTKRVTLRQLAEATGFTVNTVSRALKDQKVISIQTREAIQKKARELGYIPNRAAANLRSGKTGTIYFVCASMTNPANARLFESVRTSASQYSLDVLPIPGDGTPEGDYAALRTACSLSGDGIVYCGTMNSDIALLMKNAAVPTVLLCCSDSDHAYSSAVKNGQASGSLAANYLISTGRKAFAFVCDTDSEVSNGFFSALSESGVSGDDRRVYRPSNAHFVDEIVSFINQKGQIGLAGDSLICRSLMSELMSRGIWIPGGALLCGIGNIDAITPSPMPITQIDCSIEDMSDWAVTKLVETIANPDTVIEEKVFDPTCIIR